MFAASKMMMGRKPLPSGPSFIGHSINSGSGSTSLNIPTPAGVLPGDLLVVLLGAPGTGRTWSGSGWSSHINQGASPNLGILTTVVSSPVPSTFTFTMSGSLAAMVGQILAFRGAQFDVSSGVAFRNGTGDLVVPEINSAGGIIIMGVGTGQPNTATHTVPAGMINPNGGPVGPTSVRVSAFYQEVEPGLTGTRTTSIVTNTGVPAAAAMIGIKKS